MCIQCDRKRDCVRMLSPWLNPLTVVELQASIDFSYPFCLSSAPPFFGLLISLERIAAALKKSNKNKNNIASEIVEWPWREGEPQLVCKEMEKKVEFIELVCICVLSATVSTTKKSIECKLKLTAMMSEGYVDEEAEKAEAVQRYTVQWPASFAPSWLSKTVVPVRFSLFHDRENIWLGTKKAKKAEAKAETKRAAKKQGSIIFTITLHENNNGKNCGKRRRDGDY